MKFPRIIVTRRRRRRINGKGSIFFRPIRPLHSAGRPVDPTSLINATMPDGTTVSLCTVAVTKAPRLVVWPILPVRLSMPSDSESDRRMVDHITLELGTEKSHTTFYSPDGKTIHKPLPSRTYPLGKSGSQLWVMCAVTLHNLTQEPQRAGFYLEVPNTDTDRRIAEFIKYASTLKVSNINITHGTSPASYVLYGIIVSDSRLIAVPEEVGTPMRKLLRDIASVRLKHDEPLAIGGTCVSLRDMHISVVAACPPGDLSSSGVIGFVSDYAK